MIWYTIYYLYFQLKNIPYDYILNLNIPSHLYLLSLYLLLILRRKYVIDSELNDSSSIINT